MTPQEFFAKIARDQEQATQALKRVPEPSQVMDHDGSVNDYRKMMGTNITANYAMTLDLIQRARTNGTDQTALDLCCGPGHISICLSRYLGYTSVKGVDLSLPMVDAAKENAASQGIRRDAMRFEARDATDLSHEESTSYDLVCFTNAAHHFPDLNGIASILDQAERVAKRSGLIFLSDLARLKNDRITSEFAAYIGAGYGDHMREDFLNSLRAAWLPEEISRAVPAGSNRVWYSVVLGGVPFWQCLIGLPEGRSELYANLGLDWEQKGIFPDAESIGAWNFMMASLSQGIIRRVDPSAMQSVSRLAG